MTFASVPAWVAHSNEEWDLSYLLEADPSAVTDADLERRAIELEENYQSFHQSNGILWLAKWMDPHLDHPSHYGNGGDSAIFTGLYLAAAVYRYRVTQDPQDLRKVLETLRGLHILTHISGTPGVIARCAFPSAEGEKWLYPDAWKDRIAGGKVYESTDQVVDLLDPTKTYPKMIFYTKATRDQLTGILYGLSVAWRHAPEVRDPVGVIARAIYDRLKQQKFKLRDHEGKSGTNADKVDGILKTHLLNLMYRVSGEPKIKKEYRKAFDSSYKGLSWSRLSDLTNFVANLDDYYAWNLRFSRSFGNYILEDHPSRQENIRDYIGNRLWPYVWDHQNTHFTFLASATGALGAEHAKDAVQGLRSLSLRPLRSWSSPLHDQERFPPFWKLLFHSNVSEYVIPPHLRAPTGYFLWQRNPFETGKGIDRAPVDQGAGLDFLLPYWMGRFYGYISDGG